MWSFRCVLVLHLYLQVGQFRKDIACSVSVRSSRCLKDANFLLQYSQVCSKVCSGSFCTACLSSLWLSRLHFVLNDDLQMLRLMDMSVGVVSESSVWVV